MLSQIDNCFSRPGWSSILFFFFFNDTATTEIYTLSLHDALPICSRNLKAARSRTGSLRQAMTTNRESTAVSPVLAKGDRKSTRLNSSHSQISYAVFCLKKKKDITDTRTHTSSCASTTFSAA